MIGLCRQPAGVLKRFAAGSRAGFGFLSTETYRKQLEMEQSETVNQALEPNHAGLGLTSTLASGSRGPLGEEKWFHLG